MFDQVEVRTVKFLHHKLAHPCVYEPYFVHWSKSFGGGGNMVWGYFSGLGLGPLVPVKGTFKASAYQDIMLPTLWKQFGDGPNMTAHQCTKQGP